LAGLSVFPAGNPEKTEKQKTENQKIAMCKKIIRTKLSAPTKVLSLLAMGGLFLLSPNAARAHKVPSDCGGNIASSGISVFPAEGTCRRYG
jgi:hypothetical protein